ncbi:hypothetical protein ACRCUN_06325 [Mycobacterium sp. LTG2003]
MEVGQAPAEPTTVDLSARGTVVSNVGDIATAVGYPDVDEDNPPSLDDIRQWVLSQFFGQISPTRIPALPWAHLFDGAAELLTDPGFDNPATFASNPSITYDGEFGRLKPGSARVECDGTTHVAVSNAIEVSADETLPVSIHVFYESVTAAANSVRLSVRGYHREGDVRTLVTTSTVASLSPAGESDDDPGAVDGWLKLEGTYIVPDLPNSVDEVVLEFDVTPGATAGSLWWDDASAKKTSSGMPQAWVKDLTADLVSVWNGITGTVQSIMTQLGLTPSGDFWDDLFDLSDEIAWIQDAANQAGQDIATLLTNLWTNPAAVIQQIPQNLVNGLTTALANFNTAVNQIGDVLIGAVVTPISSAIANVVDFFHSLTNFQDTTAANQINQQNFQIAALAQGGYRNPTWVCREPIADVTYPESFLLGYFVTGVTGAASSGTAHTHTIPLSTNTYATAGLIGLSSGVSFGAYITVTATTVADTVGIYMSKDAGTVDNVYLEVFREASDRSLTRISSVDISSQLTTANQYVTAATNAGIIAQAGERYLIRVRNSSTTAVEVNIACLRIGTHSPEYAFNTLSAGLTNQTSYTTAEADAARSSATLLPWLMLASVNTGGDDQTHTDDFNNRSKLGSLWFLKSDTGSNQLGISNNRASFSGLTDGVQNALYIRPTGGDKMWVEGTLYGTAIAVPGPRCGLLLNCNRDLSQVVYLACNINTAKIYTGPWNSLTERASVSSGLNDVPWQFYYDPGAGTYYALKDGNDIGLNWPDSGGLMQHGPDFRYGGLRIARASLFNAGQIDNWTLRDWV